jgi:hypothetical protein
MRLVRCRCEERIGVATGHFQALIDSIPASARFCVEVGFGKLANGANGPRINPNER